MSRLFQHKTAADPSVALNMVLQNDLAISAESPDAVTWTVKLRTDATFQNIAPVNGRGVEAEDVKSTFIRGLTMPDSAVKADLLMMDAKQIEAPAKDTVVFKLKYAYGPFPQVLSTAWIYPREAAAGAYDPAKVVIGSGPFTIENYTPDVGSSHKPNPAWFGRPGPWIDTHKVSIIPNQAQRLAQFTAGDLDQIVVRQNDLDAARRGVPSATVVTAPDINPYQIYGHGGDPASPFADLRIRRAISMAIDRQAIGNAVFGGKFHDNGVVSFSKGDWALPPSQLSGASQYFSYNLAEAKRLVEASGAGGQLKKLVFPQAAYGQEYETIAGMINPMLNAAGIKTELVPVDYLREFLNPTKGIAFGHFDNDTLVFAILMSGAKIPEDFLFTSLVPGYTANHSQVDDPKLTDMLTKMISTVDTAERLKAFKDCQLYIADQIPYIISIPTGDAYTLLKPRVHDFAYCLVDDVVAQETYAKVWLAA